jgi:hypothetical protein
MKLKTFFYLFLIFTLSLINSKSCYSQSVLQIKNTNTYPVIDGNIDAIWNNYSAENLENLLDGNAVPNTDLSAWFKATWDQNNLYILVFVTDESKINDSGEVWKDDAVEIYIDIENNKLTSYGSTDYQYTFRWNDLSIHYNNGGTENVEFKIAGRSNGYTLETKFPWSTIGERNPKNGTLLGLDVHVHDDDDGNERDNKISWFTTTDQSWNNPSLFATVNLAGEVITNPKADKPIFSVKHGFYSQPFDVLISSPINGISIYYTLDGTDPTTSSTAKITASPAKVNINPASTSGRGKTPGVVVRAAAKKEGYDFSETNACSYIFIDEVKNQTNNPGHDWPATYMINDQEIDLFMDTQILNDSRYKNLIDDALMEVPAFSVSTDLKNLFNPQTGIYVNAEGDGSEWERPASVELLNPDGSDGFQINSGLRIRGGWSRHGYFRKHAFRLFFRNEYGEGKLDFPLFEDEGVSSFDKVDLRCAQNYSWSKGGNEAPYYTFTRDVFSRDIQKAMNQPYTRSRYYHLYINGLYWGLYQTQERSEARFAESYMGGSKEDYDVIKKDGVTDGNDTAWRELWDYCVSGFQSNTNYYRIQGLDASGKRDPNIKVLLDVDNLIDYMNIIFYTGNFDAPVSAFGGNTSPNNFYAIYNRNGSEGFKFFAHDNEHTLLYEAVPGNPNIGLYENRVDLGTRNYGNQMVIYDYWQFNPQWLHFKLSSNSEYRQRFADRAFKHLYNDGVLTPEFTANTFLKRTLEIDTAVIAESARWGDVNGSPRYTKDDHWKPMVNNTLNKYFPYRTDIVIQQLKDENLLPSVSAPVYEIDNDEIENSIVEINKGTNVSIVNPNSSGSIKYTLDGSDPRLTGGTISSTAADGGNHVSVNVLQTTIINARILSSNKWSALHTIQLNVDENIDNLQITEINYNPSGDGEISGSEFEFIELKNTGAKTINLTGSAFTNGITYSFTSNAKLEPGAFFVLASDEFYFRQRYGFNPDGIYEGQLDNKGEKLSIVDVAGDTIITFKYNDNNPWPTSPDGLGFTLVPINSNLNNDWSDGNNWRASSAINGSPKADDAIITFDPVYINEILSNSEQPATDAIEIYNPNSKTIDISGWYLSDNRSNPKKWKIPQGTTISALGYKVFYEGHYSGSTMLYSNNEFGSAFSLSSHGEDIYIFSANPAGDLTGYEHGFDYGEIETGVSFGRFILSDGNDNFVAQSAVSINKVNSYPRVGPLVMKQLMYNPGEGGFEFIEILNTSNEIVNLWNEKTLLSWKVEGINFEFPEKTTLKSGESVYLVESTINPQDFRNLNSLTANTKVYNYPSKLNNGGEEITLFKPADSYTDEGLTFFPYIRIDKVEYNNNSPWPDADGNGNILLRKGLTLYGNDPANWTASPPDISINTSFLADGIQGIPYDKELSASGGTPPYIWRIVSGTLPTGMSLNNSTGTIEGIPQVKGTFNFLLGVSDSNQLSDEADLQLAIRENTLPVAVNDTVSTVENFSVTANIINNDTDHDGDKLYWTVKIDVQPVHGTATINSDKTITYFPETGFHGSDQLTYKVSDAFGSSSAKLIINVNEELLISTIDIPINQASDDAEQNINTGQVWLGSSDIELCYDQQPGGDQIVGLRFNNIEIPKDAVINNAYIKFKCDEVTNNETSLMIKGEVSDNSSTFNSDNFNISSRPTTNSFVNWNPLPWNTEGEFADAQKTPEISTIVQEIADREGWSSGNSMSFFFTGTGTRTAEAIEGDATGAPVLHIEYSVNVTPLVPVAITGPDQNVIKGSIINLDGSQSYSPDNRQLNYIWSIKRKPNGSNAEISNPNITNPQITIDLFGTYMVSLIVNNGYFDSPETFVTIISENHLPVANAGEDISLPVSSLVQLNGNKSFDPENSPLSYYWTLTSKPSGSTATLNKNNISNPTFIADIAGSYRFRLVVSDGELQSTQDEILITITENQAPIADAGADQTVDFGKTVTINGSSSYDPEGNVITYKWSFISRPAGSNATITNSNSTIASFTPDEDGIFSIKLEVSDGDKVGSDIMQVIVKPSNYVPVDELAKSLTVYPNPFSGILNVDYISPEIQNIYFELYNTNGSLMKSFVFESSGYDSHTLDFSSCNLSEGMYLLLMKTENNAPKVVKLGYRKESK